MLFIQGSRSTEYTKYININLPNFHFISNTDHVPVGTMYLSCNMSSVCRNYKLRYYTSDFL